jgi:hypothetical protein
MPRLPAGRPPLKAPAAAPTTPHMDIKSTDDGPAGDLHLELVIYVILVGIPASVGASFGQGHVDDLVGLLFGKRAMGLGAVVLARFAAGSLRVRLGRSLGERSRLTFLGPRGFLQKLFELSKAGLPLGHPSLKICDLPVFLGKDSQELFVCGLGHRGRSRGLFAPDSGDGKTESFGKEGR